MKSPKNIDQRVNQKKYGDEFDRIFGKRDTMESATGRYQWDSEKRRLVKVGPEFCAWHMRETYSIPQLLSDGVRKMEPIHLKTKEVMHAS